MESDTEIGGTIPKSLHVTISTQRMESDREIGVASTYVNKEEKIQSHFRAQAGERTPLRAHSAKRPAFAVARRGSATLAERGKAKAEAFRQVQTHEKRRRSVLSC